VEISRPVTARSLVRRINRKLKPKDEVLRRARGAKVQLDLGRYYVVNFRMNMLIDKNVDIKDLGREVGALGPNEAVSDEE
jgi:hypothetical protein